MRQYSESRSASHQSPPLRRKRCESKCTIALRSLSCANNAIWGSQTIAMRESRMMRKYQVRFGERSRETRSSRDEKVRSAPTRLSPILANVYLHELDLFMKDLKQKFDQGKKRKKHPPYNNYTSKIARLRKKWDTLKRKGAKKEELQDIQKEIRRVDQLRKRLPCGDPFDASYKRLYYCRYADDFAIGIIGSQVDAENVRQEVKRFIQETLKLTIAEEKSHISPS